MTPKGDGSDPAARDGAGLAGGGRDAEQAAAAAGRRVSERFGRSVILIGEEPWRTSVARRLKEKRRRLRIAGELDPGSPSEAVSDIGQADVTIIDADPENVPDAIGLALSVRARDRLMAFVVVMESLRRDHLAAFESYRGSWSMVTRETSENASRLLLVIESAVRGISWMDWAIDRRLKEIEAVEARKSTATAGHDQ